MYVTFLANAQGYLKYSEPNPVSQAANCLCTYAGETILHVFTFLTASGFWVFFLSSVLTHSLQLLLRTVFSLEESQASS